MTYSFSIDPGGDMRIGIEERDGNSQTSRELLLIAGRFLAVRGAKIPAGYEIDILDAAALSWQVAAQLLARASPGDPGSLSAPIRISLAESRTAISVSTNSAEETFPPPWTARGRINPVGDRRLDFDFIFSYHTTVPPSEPMEVRYSGRWEYATPPPVIGNDSSLSGWSVFSLGTRKRREKGEDMVDFSASPGKTVYGTVGELRRAARGEKP